MTRQAECSIPSHLYYGLPTARHTLCFAAPWRQHKQKACWEAGRPCHMVDQLHSTLWVASVCICLYLLVKCSCIFSSWVCFVRCGYALYTVLVDCPLKGRDEGCHHCATFWFFQDSVQHHKGQACFGLLVLAIFSSGLPKGIMDNVSPLSCLKSALSICCSVWWPICPISFLHLGVYHNIFNCDLLPDPQIWFSVMLCKCISWFPHSLHQPSVELWPWDTTGTPPLHNGSCALCAKLLFQPLSFCILYEFCTFKLSMCLSCQKADRYCYNETK